MIVMSYYTATLLTTIVSGIGAVILAFAAKRLTNPESVLLIFAALVEFYCAKLVLEERFPFRGCSVPVLLYGISTVFILIMFFKEISPLNNQSQHTQPTRQNQITINSPTARIYNSPALRNTTVPMRLCPDWSTISLSDLGKTMCVQGNVNSAYTSSEGVYYITFNDNRDIFYALIYDFVYKDITRGECIRIYGLIEKLGHSPVIVIKDPDNLTDCIH